MLSDLEFIHQQSSLRPELELTPHPRGRAAKKLQRILIRPLYLEGLLSPAGIRAVRDVVYDKARMMPALLES